MLPPAGIWVPPQEKTVRLEGLAEAAVQFVAVPAVASFRIVSVTRSPSHISVTPSGFSITNTGGTTGATENAKEE